MPASMRLLVRLDRSRTASVSRVRLGASTCGGSSGAVTR